MNNIFTSIQAKLVEWKTDTTWCVYICWIGGYVTLYIDFSIFSRLYVIIFTRTIASNHNGIIVLTGTRSSNFTVNLSFGVLGYFCKSSKKFPKKIE